MTPNMHSSETKMPCLTSRVIRGGLDLSALHPCHFDLRHRVPRISVYITKIRFPSVFSPSAIYSRCLTLLNCPSNRDLSKHLHMGAKTSFVLVLDVAIFININMVCFCAAISTLFFNGPFPSRYTQTQSLTRR